MFKPMLADRASVETLSLPVLVSPKLDGIRCCVLPGLGPVSRNLKAIRNHWIRGKIAELAPVGYDGEIITYTAGVMDKYDDVNSKVMSADGLPEFKFHVFDNFEHSGPFYARHRTLVGSSHVEVVEHKMIYSTEALLEYERECLDAGLEGIMIRRPDGPYKYGRSTAREGWLLKLKRRIDSEATITGFEEQLHNANEATLDLLGRTERSSHKANMIPKGTLGSLLCVWDDPDAAGPSLGIDFKIGTGFDDAKRAEIWSNQERYLGGRVKFDFQGVGANGRPRFPGWLGMRGDL